MIRFRKVKVESPDQRTVLHETSFEVQPGKAIGIFGPNGSGKSTLLRVLSGEDRGWIRRGEVWVGDLPLFHRGVSAEERAQKVLYLGSDFSSPFPISVREVLEMAKQVNSRSRYGISEVGERFGISGFFSRMFDELSDGEKQRVMLARGVIQSPEWLVLDETFSKMDLHHAFHLVSVLEDIRSSGMGMILVSHDLNLLSDFSDELWLMNQGSVIRMGSVEEVLTEESLKILYPEKWIQVVRSPHHGRKKVIY